MENERTGIDDLFSKGRDYLNTRIDLFRLKAIHKVSEVLPATVMILILLGLSMMILLFLSVGLALYLGHVLGAMHYGFFIVGGIYIITGLVFFLFRKSLLKTPLSNWLIRNLMD